MLDFNDKKQEESVFYGILKFTFRRASNSSETRNDSFSMPIAVQDSTELE
jgi:hypothetical protein